MEATAGLRPMLATPGRPADVVRGHLHEIKWDGARVLAHLDGAGGMTLRSRNGADVTVAYPELADLAGRVDAADRARRRGGGARRARRRVVQRCCSRGCSCAIRRRVRVAAARSPVMYVVFDVLVCRGRPVLEHPVEGRRQRARGARPARSATSRSRRRPATSRSCSRSHAARGDEGVVSKRIGSPYRPGVRSTDWIKLPFAQQREVVVGAWRAGRVGPACRCQRPARRRDRRSLRRRRCPARARSRRVRTRRQGRGRGAGAARTGR